MPIQAMFIRHLQGPFLTASQRDVTVMSFITRHPLAWNPEGVVLALGHLPVHIMLRCKKNRFKKIYMRVCVHVYVSVCLYVYAHGYMLAGMHNHLPLLSILGHVALAGMHNHLCLLSILYFLHP